MNGIVPVFSLVLVLWMGVTAGSGSPPQSAQQKPPFRSRVDVVRLDVSVLDRNRQPVRGLTQDDFTVLVDGAPQRLVGFSAFEVAGGASPVEGWRRDVPSDVTGNDLGEGRLIVLVMDDALIPQAPAFIRDSKKIAASILGKLGPQDLAAVVFTADNRKAQDFTSDRVRLLAAVDRFNPGLAEYRFGLDSSSSQAGDGVVDTDHWYYQAAIRTLANVADSLIAVPDRRKVVFWVSPGVPVDLEDCRPVARPSTVVRCDQAPTLPSARVVELLRATDDLFRRAQRANVTIYPVDPTGLGGFQSHVAGRLGPLNEQVAAHKATMARDLLVAAAVNTGGRPVINTNEFEPGLAEIFGENQVYYLVGFEPTNIPADGKLRRLEVRVNRTDVDVRTRSGFYAPEPETADASRPTIPSETAALQHAIGGVVAEAGLPMKVALAPFAVPGQRLATVAIVLGVRQPVPADAVRGRLTETTELVTSAFTPEGEPRGSQRHAAKVVLRAGSEGEATYEVLGRIDLPAGRYRLRLAAHHSTTGKTGSVFADVIVPDYASVPFSAAPVILAAVPARTSVPKGLLSPLLPFAPTVEREFLVSDTVTALLRLYTTGQEPLDRVRVTIAIRDARNSVVVEETRYVNADRFRAAAPARVAATGALPSRPGSWRSPDRAQEALERPAFHWADVTYRLPLTRLSPGEHLLTFEAALGAQTIRRDLRFSLRQPAVA